MKTRLYSKIFGTGFSALKHRNFRLFFIGQCISLIGTWMQNIGQTWLVLQITHSALKLSAVTMMQFLPMMIFSLFAGTLIDRFPKRNVLIFTQTSMMVLAVILATLAYFNVVEYWHILVLALLLGIVNTLDMPTRHSYFIELVGRKDLMNAIALNSGIFNLARVVGPAIAGILIGLVGIPICFYLNALSFVAVLIGLFMIKTTEVQALPPKIESIHQVVNDIKDGLKYIRHTNIILIPLILIFVISLFAMNYSVLIPLFASQTLSQDAAGYGFIMTCMGLGSFVGAMVIAARSQSGPKFNYMVAGALATCLFMAILGLEHTYLIACITVFIIGLSSIVFTALANSIIQLNAADHMRGRVMSVYTLVFLGVTPIGSLATGGLIEIIGISNTMVISGVVSAVITVLTVYLLKRNRTPQTA
ncbi:MAG: MFS transporter [Erysipelotrichales bacterium]|nr:MAG: MFS transporter [Erysipelotrichales bacterium]